VRNNPLKYVDPSGQFFVDTITDIGSVSVGVAKAFDAMAAVTAASVVGDWNMHAQSMNRFKSALGETAIAGAAAMIPGVPAVAIKTDRIEDGAALVREISGKVGSFTDKFKASREQMKNLDFREIAGGKTGREFRDAKYKAGPDGSPSDYVKQSSHKTRFDDGTSIETHSVRNDKTGEVSEQKTKISKKKSDG
jgi:hypothetical protein